MSELRFTFVGEGPSDAALVPILQWLLRQKLPGVNPHGGPPNFRRLRRPPRSLIERISMAVTLVPCDLLFVHRDADSADHATRTRVIRDALEAARATNSAFPSAVPVVPVRMLEAWLLFREFEAAVRSAANNPGGRQGLTLPPVRRIERLRDPKQTLRELIHQASGLRGRHLDRVRVNPTDVVSWISDFSPLRQLPAFQALEADVERVIQEQGWPGTLPDQP